MLEEGTAATGQELHRTDRGGERSHSTGSVIRLFRQATPECAGEPSRAPTGASFLPILIWRVCAGGLAAPLPFAPALRGWEINGRAAPRCRPIVFLPLSICVDTCCQDGTMRMYGSSLSEPYAPQN